MCVNILILTYVYLQTQKKWTLEINILVTMDLSALLGPNLNRTKHQLKSIFDEECSQNLVAIVIITVLPDLLRKGWSERVCVRMKRMNCEKRYLDHNYVNFIDTYICIYNAYIMQVILATAIRVCILH